VTDDDYTLTDKDLEELIASLPPNCDAADSGSQCTCGARPAPALRLTPDAVKFPVGSRRALRVRMRELEARFESQRNEVADLRSEVRTLAAMLRPSNHPPSSRDEV